VFTIHARPFVSQDAPKSTAATLPSTFSLVAISSAWKVIDLIISAHSPWYMPTKPSRFQITLGRDQFHKQIPVIFPLVIAQQNTAFLDADA
jgi:hypothetical protein